MPVHPKLLEVLICPACRGDVEPTDNETGLRCSGCGRVYPIRDGIPVMLIDQASPPEPRDEQGGGSRSE